MYQREGFIVSSDIKPYEPTTAEKATAQAKRQERKKFRPANWKSWLEDDDDEEEEKKTEVKNEN